jgi:ABC-type transport system substrate-binding protein
VSGLRSDAAPKPGGTMKVALLRDPTGWDPHINYGATTYTFQANIYEGLLRYSLKGVLEPGLAVRWESPNPTTYVLHLRKGVRFHSGNPFTADDVKWNIERIQTPATNATRAKEFEVIEAVTAVDPSTVRIALKQPTTAFLEMLAAAEAVIADSKWATGVGDLKKSASGTGPFKLGPYETGVRYALVKNTDYWESPYPYLDRIRLSTVAKDDVRVEALKTGSVDLAEYIPWQEIKDLEEGPADQGPRRLRHLQRDPHEPQAPAVRQREGPPGAQLPRGPQGDHRAGVGRHRPPVRCRADP